MAEKINRDYGISPYQSKVDQDTQQDDFAYIDQMQTPTWFQAMALALQKHSELIKPYQNESYPEAEQFYPTPLYQPPPGQPQQSYLGMGGGGCVLNCFAPLYCKDPVKCHPAIYYYDPHLGLQASLGTLQIKVLVDGIPAKVDFNPTRVFPWEIPPPKGSWPSWPDHPMSKLKAKMRDGAKHVCETSLDVFCRRQDCCLMDSYVAVSFDDGSTPDTIARNGSITCYLLNGCPPYSWSVSGTGFSFTYTTSTGLTNTLNASGTACGTATCVATDKCGHSVTFYILCTTGTWHNGAQCNATDPGGSTWPVASCETGGSFFLYSGPNKRWYLTPISWCYYGAYGVSTWGVCVDPPPCGLPLPCNVNPCTCFGNPGHCIIGTSLSQSWLCS